MLIVIAIAALAAAGFLTSILMGITLVGVCRYGERYPRFFERLKTLGALGKIKEIAELYLGWLNKFVGRNVGFKQEGVVEKRKLIGIYIEHLLLIYWFVGTILVLSFRPVEPFGEHTNSLLQAAAFLVLLSINVLSDAISILWTKRCIAILAAPQVPLTMPRLFSVLAQDILVAVVLMIAVQFISNGLYAVQIGKADRFLDYMLDFRTALKPYAPIDPHLSDFVFPGQLAITCTTYIPSLLFYAICIGVLLLKPFYTIFLWILDILNIDVGSKRRRRCNPIGYIGSLAGTLGIALASAKIFVDAVR